MSRPVWLQRVLGALLACALLAGCADSSDSGGAAKTHVSPAVLGLRISTSTVEFGDVFAGSAETFDLEIRNTTALDVEIAEISLDPRTSPDFALLSSGQSISLAAGASIEVRIQYSPASTGQDSGELRIATADGRETAIRLRGRGVLVPVPEIDVSASSLVFGKVQVGGSSSLSLTVRNRGSAPLAISEVSIGGSGAASFSLSPQAWQGNLAPGARQLFAVAFAPSSTGDKTASVTIRSDDADEALITISLSGCGTPRPTPEIEVSPLSLSFGEVTLGSSRTAAFRVRNRGTGWLHVTRLALGSGTSSEFALKDAPTAASVAPGGYLSVSVAYVPADLVADSRTVEIESDDEDEPVVTVSLSGYGTPAPVPEAIVSPLALAFGEVQLGSSRELTVTVENKGNAVLNVSKVALSSGSSKEFSIVSGGSSANISFGSSVTIVVRYAPTNVGFDSGALVLTTNDADERQVKVSLSGTGVAVPAPEIEVSPAALAFGNVVLGQSKSLGLTVRNTGNAVLQVSQIALGSGTSLEFSIISGGSAAQIPAGGSLVISVSFAPQTTGTRIGTLVVASDDADEATVTVSLTGTGIPAPAPEIEVTPASLAFGEVSVGSSKTLGVSVSNRGTAGLTVTSIAIGQGSSSAFSIASGGASGTIAAGASRSVQVRYAPPAEGTDYGSLVIRSNDADEPEVSVPVSGTGRAGGAGLRALTLAWDPPTTNEDGTPLTDLAGYKLYYGSASRVYAMVLDVGNVTEYSLELAPGTYYFAATAYNLSGGESQYSVELPVPLE